MRRTRHVCSSVDETRPNSASQLPMSPSVDTQADTQPRAADAGADQIRRRGPSTTLPLTPETVVVNEIFGPTFQGEGPSSGRLASFIRLARCDLACLYCDSAHAWDFTGVLGRAYDPRVEAIRRPVDAVVDAVHRKRARLVVITGGEPLLQRLGVQALGSKLIELGHNVEVETNGRHLPVDAPVVYNVSPKLAYSGESRDRRIRPDVLVEYVSLAHEGRARFKFVVSGRNDLQEVAAIVEEVGISDDVVWIMAQGTAAEAVMATMTRVADDVIAQGWNMTSRLHVLLWGDERGR